MTEVKARACETRQMTREPGERGRRQSRRGEYPCRRKLDRRHIMSILCDSRARAVSTHPRADRPACRRFRSLSGGARSYTARITARTDTTLRSDPLAIGERSYTSTESHKSPTHRAFQSPSDRGAFLPPPSWTSTPLSRPFQSPSDRGAFLRRDRDRSRYHNEFQSPSDRGAFLHGQRTGPSWSAA